MTDLKDEPPLGHKIRFLGECGHWFVTYTLEPTPPTCPDCADKDRKVIADLLRDLRRHDFDVLPGDDTELDRWLDDTGVTDDAVRKDIHELAMLIDDARQAIDNAEFRGRRILDKYPPAERLTMNEGE